MDGNAISSVTTLLIYLKKSERFSDNSEDDINTVIECVENLYNDFQNLRSALEAATIDAGRAWRRFTALREDCGVELKNASKIARADNARYIQELQNEMKRINEELEAQRKKSAAIAKEKENLMEKSSKMHELWPEISIKVSKTLEKKATARMKVNETRCQTIDTHDKVLMMMGEADELCRDIEEYWNYCLSQMSKIKPQADETRAKIATQDHRTSLAKAHYETVDKKFRKAQKLYAAQEKITLARETNAEDIRAKRAKQETIIGNKRTRFKAAVDELEMLQAQLDSQTHDYEEKVASLERKLDVVLEETTRELEERAEMRKTRNEMAESLEAKKEQMKDDGEKVKLRKTELMDMTHMLDAVSEEATFAKNEKEDTNSRIATVLKYREMTRSIYDRKITKLEHDLGREEECRKSELSQVKQLVEDMHAEKDKMVKFTKNGEKQLNLLIEQKALWKRDHKETSESVESYRRRREKLVHDEEITERYYEIVLQELREDIAKIETSSENSSAAIASLQTRFDELEPKHCRVCVEYAEVKESHTLVRNDIVSLNRTVRDMSLAKDRKNKEIKELDKMKERIKEEIAQTNAEASEYFSNMNPLKETNLLVCEEMKRHERLYQENHRLSYACEKTREHVKEARRMIAYTENNMKAMEDKLVQNRDTLDDSVTLTLQQTDEARIRDTDLIEDIAAKRDFSKYRHSALDNVIGQMVDILGTMDDFQSGKKNLHKPSVCGGKTRRNS